MTTPTRTLRSGGRRRGMPEVTAASQMVLLADVSEYQPDLVDATYLAWSKAVAVRAMYGDAHDDAAWYGGARRSALHAGGARAVLIYQYLVAEQSGAAQAQAFHKLVGAIQPGEIFVGDFEEGAPSMLNDWRNTMISLYGYGIEPYLWTYSDLWFGQQQGVMPVQWLADYTSTEPDAGQKLWQFSESYQVPGVGTADCSLFHGTIDQLAALAYPAAPPPDWVFGQVRSLKVVNVGPTSVKLSWDAPGSPEPLAVADYEVVIQRGGLTLASYPRTEPKGSNPEEFQFGSLPKGTGLEAWVRAQAAGGAHSSPWAKVSFKTPAS